MLVSISVVMQVDVFGSWDHNAAARASSPAPPVDPFGGDAFASQTKGANDLFGSEPFNAGGGGGPPPRPESPTPALPPKKSKQPPPRPAPPKARPVKPPPPQINSNNNPTKGDATPDPFTGGWGDKSGGDNFDSDFANFADFDNKCSKVVTSNTTSPWGDERNFSAHPGQDEDPFGPPFSAVRAKGVGSGDASPWPHDAFASPGVDSGDAYAESGGFGQEDPFGSPGAGSGDPFGGDYDPFKDQDFKEADKFSWEDEPDPFGGLTEDGDGDGKAPGKLQGSSVLKADPFDSHINEEADSTDMFAELSGNKRNIRPSVGARSHLSPNQKSRSRSVIGDPFASQTRETVQARSKTSLGEPWDPSLDFDPFSSTQDTTAEVNKWRSNEDLLNENLSGWGAANNNNNNNINNNNNQDGINPFGDSFTSPSQPKAARPATEDEQLVWAAQESLRLEEVRRQQEQQEQAELELALRLSRRSPSTGL
ncbi:hypothetical protein GWK47_003427 [Chionoecetes opilio]|uniref:Epidermal growth factor receptor substrate 15 n=1 Tax=Chionoecetes opilio TaxID=41210 RepID=A0A8J5D1T2_CHIOP|nr:hypothetical protein GWK47_003427 [Chionoecetes opilio]